jgi:CheY-like chemotaxis protein
MTSKKNSKLKKKIFWFEDDPYTFKDFYEKLNKEYEVNIGAGKYLIEKKRDFQFDLILLDLMIHKHSFKDDSNEQVENITFEEDGVRTHWTDIGVEFLRRLREGEYEIYGFPKGIPVIAATARIDSSIREIVEKLGVNKFLVKPFTMDKLKISIEQALNSSNTLED